MLSATLVQQGKFDAQSQLNNKAKNHDESSLNQLT